MIPQLCNARCQEDVRMAGCYALKALSQYIMWQTLPFLASGVILPQAGLAMQLCDRYQIKVGGPSIIAKSYCEILPDNSGIREQRETTLFAEALLQKLDTLVQFCDHVLATSGDLEDQIVIRMNGVETHTDAAGPDHAHQSRLQPAMMPQDFVQIPSLLSDGSLPPNHGFRIE